MRNVTVSLDEEVARWARIRAAELDSSVSRLIGEMLRERMLEEKGYEVARQQYLARAPLPLKKRDARYPGRAELYDRRSLR